MELGQPISPNKRPNNGATYSEMTKPTIIVSLIRVMFRSFVLEENHV